MTRRVQSDVAFLALLTTAIVANGCASHHRRRYITDAASRILARTAIEFDKGVFYKPAQNAMTGIEASLVPLIIDEVSADNSEGRQRTFGTVERDSSDALTSDQPTVYTLTSKIGINGTERDQVVYVWWYGRDDGRAAGRGVRIVLGRDGFPLLWEALTQRDDDLRVLFVSDSLERAARRQFGAPLPGRRFAVERSTDIAPTVLVARVLADGPIPMGPFVYLTAPPARDITTVICRCMPSQVHEITQTAHYDLSPIEAVARSFSTGFLSRILRSHDDLGPLLRWPDQSALPTGTERE